MTTSQTEPNDELSPTHAAPAPNNDRLSNDEKAVSTVRFRMILAGLILAVLISALDGAVVPTALPTIVQEFALGPDYIWVVDIYFLTTAAFQPLFGQLADLWGRRWVFVGTVAVFVLGSGLIGGATSGTMLIAGRGVQGVGAGGINMMVDLILCDMVPLRRRSSYMGMIFGVATTVAGLGPVIGGVLTTAGAWRWIFWMNLPVGVVCIAIMLLCHRVPTSCVPVGFGQSLRQIDWFGTAIIVGSTTAVLFGLAYGGSAKPWTDSGVIASLVVGLASLLLYGVWEGTSWCRHPLTPLRLFSSRTLASVFFLTFTNVMLIFWRGLMFPLYFQAVLGANPTRSGIWVLPFALTFPFATAFAGALTTKIGRYKPFHLVGFALLTLGYGLCSLLDEESNAALWVIFQIILSLGIAAPIACLLPAIQASLPDKDNASSTATWAFIRSFGSIWGAAIPAAIFNDRFDQLRHSIQDESISASLANGQAYAKATTLQAMNLSQSTRIQVLRVYALAMQRVWQIGIVFAGISLCVVFAERELPMRRELQCDTVSRERYLADKIRMVD